MNASKLSPRQVQLTALLGFLTTASTTAFWLYIVQPSFSSTDATIHPTSIPWLQNQLDCKKTGRTWQDGACWDQEHNPEF
jgi:hypothetical protein